VTRRIWVVLASIWFFGVGFYAHANAEQTPHGHRDIYNAWYTSPNAPLSIVFKGRCIEAEDSAAHLVLVDYDRGKTVIGCKHRGF
jgi:hypothetical protein